MYDKHLNFKLLNPYLTIYIRKKKAYIKVSSTKPIFYFILFKYCEMRNLQSVKIPKKKIFVLLISFSTFVHQMVDTTRERDS